MCDWQEYLFECNHSLLRLKSYCHFARNDPNHQCMSIKVLRTSWAQEGMLCDDCIARGYRFLDGRIWQVPRGAASQMCHQHQHQHQHGGDPRGGR